MLLVEDLAELRDVLRRLLLSQGYHVISAGDGEAALRQAELTPVDLLLTDWQLPGMSGRDLALALAAKNPRLRVLLTSGKVAGDAENLAWLQGLGEYLAKPYDFDVMFAALKRLETHGKPFT